MTTSSIPDSTTDQARQTAATAAQEGQHVAGVAADEARSVAGEAAQQARSVADDAISQVRGQLDDQSRQSKSQLAGTLGTFGDDLSRMSESGSGLAADVAGEVAERARSLSRHLDDREPAELLDDVRRFARQRPGAFLLGALATGVVAGRLLRGTKDAVEAAEAEPATSSGPTEPVDVTPSGHGQPTQPPTATGYSSPPPGIGLPSAPDAPGGVTP